MVIKWRHILKNRQWSLITNARVDTAATEILDDGNFATAIVTPLMKRISCGFNECGEIRLIDASGNVDRFGCNIFIIYTNNCAGGLPVG